MKVSRFQTSRNKVVASIEPVNYTMVTPGTHAKITSVSRTLAITNQAPPMTPRNQDKLMVRPAIQVLAWASLGVDIPSF